MSNIGIKVHNGSLELKEILRDTSIGNLYLGQADCLSLVSEILSTLNKRTKLYLCGTYTGRCDLKLPASLQGVSLFECECSSEWLCSLLITLSSYAHIEHCLLDNVVLRPCEEARADDNHIHLSDLRSDILSRDLSNIWISVENGSIELLKRLRDIRGLKVIDIDNLKKNLLRDKN
ncbi:hypothetical protein DPMN_176691 [Dreissena polymorpha]|uniref:Uncharacterized protein n=1 Tax=Dreissena polymorpha TaxID=45954 RepID=A0A9D4EBH4_DREPO|nr:hypothetical protein DPMN_176691 [Dreissena polymorpha]